MNTPELVPQRLYMPGEVAKMFNVGRPTVSRWFSAGTIPAERIVTTPGGHRRVNADYIDALLRGES